MRTIKIVSAVVVISSFLLVSPATVTAQKTAATAKPTVHEAHAQMREALAAASKSHQSVLVKFSASWCGPCHAFDRFLNDTTGVGAIMQKHFVVVGMTALEIGPKDSLDTPGAEALSREMGGDLKRDTGIPYFFMLNADGTKTGDSKNMPDKSNIGYPETAVEVQQFDLLLQKTAPRMTADERARIKKFLDKAAGR